MSQARTTSQEPGSGSRAPARIFASLALLAACVATVARAGEPFAAPAPAPAAGAAPSASFTNDYALLLGGQYWDRLDDFEPSLPAGATGRAGRMEPGGANLEGSYHRRVTRWLGWDIFLGGDFGVFYHSNKERFDATLLPSGEKIGGELSARGLYLTPSVKFVSGEPAPWRYSVGAGVGYFLVDLSTQLDDAMIVDTYFRDETVGGYLSLGADRILWRSSTSILLRLEAKVLYADFGSPGSFAPGAGSIAGPIFMFQAGVALAN